MVLLIDNYDSFTYNLYDYMLQLGQPCKVVRNDELSIDELEALNFSSAVISPGPKTPEDAGITMSFIQKFYQTKPILGICLGHQAIGEFFGAKLVKTIPMHGKASVINCKVHPLFAGLPQQIEVMRYHSLLLNGVDATPLQTIAVTADNETMALVHPQYKLAGVQFHPESILTPNGLTIMKNWFDFIK